MPQVKVHKEVAARMAEPEEEWNKLFAEYCEKFPEMKELWDKYYNGCDMSDLFNSIPDTFLNNVCIANECVVTS